MLDLSAAEIRRLVEEALAPQAGAPRGQAQPRPRGQDPRAALHQALDAHAPLLPGRHDAARRLDRAAQPRRDPAQPRRDARGHRPRGLALPRRDRHPHLRARRDRGLGRGRDDPGHQRPLGLLAPLPDPRRPADHPRGARRRSGGCKVAYIGDGNNVAHSWILAAGLLGLDFVLAAPAGYDPDPGVLAEAAPALDGARRAAAGRARPRRGRRRARTSSTPTSGRAWARRRETKRRLKAFRGYQIDAKLLARAKRGAGVLHCLPAHRGEEITAEVIDGPQSLVFDQAENRLHAQKALLVRLLARASGADHSLGTDSNPSPRETGNGRLTHGEDEAQEDRAGVLRGARHLGHHPLARREVRLRRRGLHRRPRPGGGPRGDPRQGAEDRRREGDRARPAPRVRRAVRAAGAAGRRASTRAST